MGATNNKSSEQPPELSENSKLSKSSFIIKEQIGGGSFGIIYKAYDNFNKREVAIKITTKITFMRVMKKIIFYFVLNEK